jgi:glycosyltransferase involved in cell wall biosynthesis
MQDKKGKVLVVSYYLPPDISPGSLRVSGLMRGLLRQGWDVAAISVRNTPQATRDDSSMARLPDGIEVARTSHWDLYGRVRRIFGLEKIPSSSRSKNGFAVTGGPASTGDKARASGIGRVLRFPVAAACRVLGFPDRYVGWVPPLVLRAGKMIGEGNIDIVLSSSPPHSSHLAIYILSYFKRFKWVADFRDPWTVPNRRGKGGFFMGLRRRLERWILGRCDRIIANTPGNRDALLAAFPFLDSGKVSVITNAFDMDEDMDEDREEPASPKEAGECDVVYTGEIYLGMLDLLLEAMRIIVARKSIVPPVFHIYGLVHPQDLEKIARLGLQDHFKYHGFIPYGRSLRVMKEARALLLLLPHAGDATTWVPSKLYRYIGSGRPILALAPQGDASSIIDETGVGLAVTDANAETVADRLGDFITDLRSGTLHIERNEEKIRRYSMDAIVSRLDRILLEEMGV